jgi:chromosome segregation ATPase
VNANFTAVKTAVDDNDSRIAALEATLAALRATFTSQEATISTLQDTVNSKEATISAIQDRASSRTPTISTLQSDLDDVQSSKVMALNRYLTVSESDVGDTRGPLVQLAGVNLQIVNGTGSTYYINGPGNWITNEP